MNPELSLKLQTLYKLPVCITKEKMPRCWASPRITSRHWCRRVCSNRSVIHGVIV